jgi:MFS superfamily sulfate permease-like transporter
MIHRAGYYLRHVKEDIPAGIVVFLVALPLCLGIALASGTPLFSGLIAGLVGGLVVSLLSGSQLAVSGPAAGLTVIVFNALQSIGNFQGLLVACVLAGVLQLAFGFLKAGVIASFFPSAVIKGMLAAIGLILIIKQIPHATGFDSSFEGDEDYMAESASSSFHELSEALQAITPGAVAISVVGLLILIVWELPWFKKQALLKLIPGPLVAVLWGVGFNLWASRFAPDWQVKEHHMVELPLMAQPMDFFDNLVFPDVSYLSQPQVYVSAITIAIIASLETLLSLEATDKLDPLKRLTPTNRELKAQGVGNIISGLLGGLPMTAVIVRSSANINAGGKTSLSCFVHGVCLLISILFFARYLNQIPLSCLAAILLFTGYKLAKPTLFMEHYRKGMSQFLPFVITVAAIIATDLLKGMAIGMVIGLFFVIRANYNAAITMTMTKNTGANHYLIALNKDVSFLNKALLRKFILMVEEHSKVTIDASKVQFIDHDILETIDDFIDSAADSNITIETIDLHGKHEIKKHEEMVVIENEHPDKARASSNNTLPSNS